MEDDFMVKQMELNLMKNADKIVQEKIRTLITQIQRHELDKAAGTSFDLFITLFRTNLTNMDPDKWQMTMEAMTHALWDSPEIVVDAISKLPDAVKGKQDVDFKEILKSLKNPFAEMNKLRKRVAELEVEAQFKHEAEYDN